MAATFTFPLAQLVDLLPNWGWNALFAGGMLAPLIGLVISLGTRTMVSWKRNAVIFFYALSLPLAGLVFVAQTETPAGVCSFIILMPVGMILGLAVLAPRGHVSEQRGFEVQPRQDGEAEHCTGSGPRRSS